MTFPLKALLLSVLFVWGAAGVQAAGPATSAALPMAATPTVLLDIKPDPWQVRRKQVIDLVAVIQKSDYKDKAAKDKFDKVLADFDKDFVSITPMEAMDLQRMYYVPVSKPEEMESNLGA